MIYISRNSDNELKQVESFKIEKEQHDDDIPSTVNWNIFFMVVNTPCVKNIFYSR